MSPLLRFCHEDLPDKGISPRAKLGLVWDTGLMTTGQAALYSVCIGHTENFYLEVAMNTYFPQVEKRSHLSSYVLAVFAICTLLMLVLSFSRFFENRWSMPSVPSGVVTTESANMPVAIPAPVPPTDQVQMSVTPLPAGSLNPVPQVVPVPVPSVP
jgi:hypothetical protein